MTKEEQLAAYKNVVASRRKLGPTVLKANERFLDKYKFPFDIVGDELKSFEELLYEICRTSKDFHLVVDEYSRFKKQEIVTEQKMRAEERFQSWLKYFKNLKAKLYQFISRFINNGEIIKDDTLVTFMILGAIRALISSGIINYYTRILMDCLFRLQEGGSINAPFILVIIMTEGSHFERSYLHCEVFLRK